jgi:hypothetical protein
MASTKVVNLYVEPFDVYIGRGIGRGRGSKWGNLFSHKNDTLAALKVATREEAIDCHRTYLLTNRDLVMSVYVELKGKTLGCFCKPAACHGDTYAWLLDHPSCFCWTEADEEDPEMWRPCPTSCCERPDHDHHDHHGES